MGDPVNLVCKTDKMDEWSTNLTDISETMAMLVVKTAECQLSFQDAYVGDATTEVEDFFESLLQHLYRLSVFYSKMSQFIDMTKLSFSESDVKMTEKMGD